MAGGSSSAARHEELLACGGLYAGMWNRQREAAEAEERLREFEESDTEGYVHRTPAPQPEAAE